MQSAYANTRTVLNVPKPLPEKPANQAPLPELCCGVTVGCKHTRACRIGTRIEKAFFVFFGGIVMFGIAALLALAADMIIK